MPKIVFISLIASVMILAGLTLLVVGFLPSDMGLSLAILSPIGMLAALAIKLK